jgi:hypothetical protein
MMNPKSTSEQPANPDPSEIAKAFSSLGASKGGLARAKSLSPERRSEIARSAVEARWEKAGKFVDIHQAPHTGVLEVGNASLACAVLDDGTRVISERGLLAGLGIKAGGELSKAGKGELDGAAGLPLFVAHRVLRPFIDKDLAVLLQNPILYRAIQGGKPAHGLKAELIPQVCNVWLKARDAGVLTTESQKRIAVSADILMRGLANVGIVALVDEATGYQDIRARDALAKILEAFVAKELRKWVKTFPPDYYRELFRLRGLKYPPEKNPPQYIGTLTNDIVYSRLAPAVLGELRTRNPTNEHGHRKSRHHQWLTEQIGHPKLLQHLSAVVALMRISKNGDYSGFKSILDRALPKYVDGSLPFADSPEE